MAEDMRKKSIIKSQKICEDKKHNKYKERIPSIKLPKIVQKFILLIIFYNSFSLSEEKSFKLRKLEFLSKITVVIRGNGTKNILANKTGILPIEVYINNNKKNIINKSYLLEKEENIIDLTFDNSITNCSYMFSDLIDVIEIDLSQFDSTNINDMTGMFYGCKNLKKINFTNFDTANYGKIISRM